MDEESEIEREKERVWKEASCEEREGKGRGKREAEGRTKELLLVLLKEGFLFVGVGGAR